jgi:hypothetical protein
MTLISGGMGFMVILLSPLGVSRETLQGVDEQPFFPTAYDPSGRRGGWAPWNRFKADPARNHYTWDGLKE